MIAGGIIGGAFIEYFSALLTDNTIESARLMADEGDAQMSIPGVLEALLNDYNKVIEMAEFQLCADVVAINFSYYHPGHRWFYIWC